EVYTLFLGGGTPTHLRGEQLIRLLTTVLRWHPLSGNSNIEFRNPKQIRSTKSEACLRPAGPHPDPLSATVDLRPEGWGDEITEFSVEANPADVDLETVAILADHGVTRISLGGQSFQQGKLKVLERDHLVDDIARAVELARGRGLDVSLDLIFGVPGETLC